MISGKMGMIRGVERWGQISTFDIRFLNPRTSFVDLLTETASRMRAKASRLILIKSCGPFATRQRSNVKCLDATPDFSPRNPT